MGILEPAHAGRLAYRRREWASARALLEEADRRQPLPGLDLELLAHARALAGDAAGSAAVLARGHREHLAASDVEGAVRCAFWAAMRCFDSGDAAQGGGWLARAGRLVRDHRLDSVQSGYLKAPEAIGRLQSGQVDAARQAFQEAADIGARFADPDLETLALMGVGQALIAGGQVANGLVALDEAMVRVLAGEVSEVPTGIIYCAVIGTCHQLFDLHRAQEWTRALDGWCASQPQLVPFTGQCQVHRAELLLLHGEWTGAVEAARTAQQRFELQGVTAAGAALYVQAEVHRLRGELEEAEQRYRDAALAGHDPQPGMALLRVAQGRTGDAAASVRRALAAADTHSTRTRLLPACVEVLLADGDVPRASACLDELLARSGGSGSAWLTAVKATAEGAVLLAQGRPADALPRLRRAVDGWQTLQAPYDAARARLLLAQACGAMGDEDGAALESDTAVAALRGLGAPCPAARPAGTTAGAAVAQPGLVDRLTAREVEVLRLVASGLTNREIAGRLVLSEKTVARHLSNLFAKLGVPSRSAATAFAYEHRVVRPSAGSTAGPEGPDRLRGRWPVQRPDG